MAKSLNESLSVFQMVKNVICTRMDMRKDKKKKNVRKVASKIVKVTKREVGTIGSKTCKKTAQ